MKRSKHGKQLVDRLLSACEKESTATIQEKNKIVLDAIVLVQTQGSAIGLDEANAANLMHSFSMAVEKPLHDLQQKMQEAELIDSIKGFHKLSEQTQSNIVNKVINADAANRTLSRLAEVGNRKAETAFTKLLADTPHA